MSVDQEIIVDGHVASLLLRDFAEHPDNFDDDTVEAIWKHLDDCEDCIEDYEAIRDDRIKDLSSPIHDEESPTPPVVSGTGGTDAFDLDAFDPDDLSDTEVPEEDDDDSHINGLMPVGDNHARNGLPEEYTDSHDSADPESPDDGTESAKDVTDADAPADDSGEDEKESAKIEAPAIEGLITGEVAVAEEPVDSLETETAAEAGARLAEERRETDERDDDTESQDAEEKPSNEEVEEEDDPFIDPAKDTHSERRPTISRSSVHPFPDLAPFEAAGQTKTGRQSAAATAFAEPEQEALPEETIELPDIELSKNPPEAQPPEAQPPKPASSSRPAKSAPHRKPERTTRPAKTEPLEDFFNNVLSWITRPRNAIICGVTVLSIAAAFVLYFTLAANQTTSPVAGWAPLNVIETRVPLQEVLVRKIRNGRVPTARGVDVTLDFRGIDKLVIAVDLDFLSKKALTYEVVVRDPQRSVVFQEAIPQFYVDEGRFFLRLVPKQFEVEQQYRLDLISHQTDGSPLVVAESVFDVIK